jgi:hypothetical protein
MSSICASPNISFLIRDPEMDGVNETAKNKYT